MPQFRDNKLSPKQEGFIRDYIETGNATEAAARNYDVANRNVANAIGSENLAKPSVMEKIRSYADMAANNIVVLANTAENETVKLNANRDILDRSGYKPADKVVAENLNTNVNLDTSIDATDPMIEAILKETEEKIRKRYE